MKNSTSTIQTITHSLMVLGFLLLLQHAAMGQAPSLSVYLNCNGGTTFQIDTTIVPVTCHGMNNGSIELTVNGGTTPYSYAWTTNSTSNINPVAEDQFDLSGGTYSVDITDANGCSASLSFFLEEPAPLTSNISAPTFAGGDHISCNGAEDGTIDLSIYGGTPGYTYQWSSPNGSGWTPSTEDQAFVGAGDYMVAVTDAHGCSVSKSITLTEPTLLDATINILTDYAGRPVSCSGKYDGSLKVEINGGSSGYLWNWDNFLAANAISYNNVGEGPHMVAVTDTNGCTAHDTVFLTAHPLPEIITQWSVQGCEGETVNIEAEQTNFVSCQWKVSNGAALYGPGPHALMPDPGCYDVTLVETTAEGCIDSVSIADHICIHPNPDASFEVSADDISMFDGAVQLNNTSSNAAQALWEFEYGVNQYTWDATFSFPEEAGYYSVFLTVFSSEGCTDTITQLVRVKEEQLLYVPNAFTPNGDISNQTFRPEFGGGYSPKGYELSIFNRWGNLIFESRNMDYGWDGAINGNPAQSDVYLWRIKVRTSEDEKSDEEIKVYQGHVNLLR